MCVKYECMGYVCSSDLSGTNASTPCTYNCCQYYLAPCGAYNQCGVYVATGEIITASKVRSLFTYLQITMAKKWTDRNSYGTLTVPGDLNATRIVLASHLNTIAAWLNRAKASANGTSVTALQDDPDNKNLTANTNAIGAIISAWQFNSITRDINLYAQNCLCNARYDAYQYGSCSCYTRSCDCFTYSDIRLKKNIKYIN